MKKILILMLLLFIAVPAQARTFGTLKSKSLISCDTIDTDATGLMSCGTDDSAGSPAYDTIGDPTGAGSISFDDEETATYTTVQDTANDFFTLINTNAAVGNQVYMLNLDYSVDDGEALADFIKIQDAGGSLLTVQEQGKILMTPGGAGTHTGLDITPSTVISTADATWKGINIDGAALDPSSTDQKIIGMEIDLSGVVPTGSGLYMEGLELKMPDVTYNAIDVESGRVMVRPDLPATAAAHYELINVSPNASSLHANSEVHALGVEVTGGSPAGEVVAVGTHTNVHPIHQHIGAYATPEQSSPNAESLYEDGGAVSEGIDTNEILKDDNDYIWVGQAQGDGTFDEIEVIMTTPATKDCSLTFFYINTGDAEVQFYPDDSTIGLKRSGLIEWDAASFTNWKATYDPDAGDSEEGYWIKIYRTSNADPGTPTPASMKTGSPTEYYWDKTGDIYALDITAVDDLTAGDDVAASGKVTAGEEVTAGTHVTAGTDVNVGADINLTGDLWGSGIADIDGPVTITNGTLIMDDNTTGHLIVADGTDFGSVAMSGDTTINSAGAVKIGTDKVQTDELDISAVSAPIAADIAEGELADSIIISADIKNGEVAFADLGTDLITGAAAVGAFASGDTFLCQEAGVGVRECDYDDIPSGGASALTDLSDVNSATVTAGRLLVADGSSFHSVDTVFVSTTLDRVGIGTLTPSDTLEVAGDIELSGAGNPGISPDGETADPCGTEPEGHLFYNSTNHFWCFCNDAGADIKMNDNSTACF